MVGSLSGTSAVFRPDLSGFCRESQLETGLSVSELETVFKGGAGLREVAVYSLSLGMKSVFEVSVSVFSFLG